MLIIKIKNFMLTILLVSPIFIFLIYFISNKFYEQQKVKKELKYKNNLVNSLLDYKDIISEEKISEIKTNSKLTPLELELIVNSELKSANLQKKYGQETAQSLKEAKWFLGMTIEQLIDAKGEPDSISRENVRKIVKSKFGTFAQNKEKATLIYGEQKFIFVEGKLENCG